MVTLTVFLFETIIFCQFVLGNIHNEIIDKFGMGGENNYCKQACLFCGLYIIDICCQYTVLGGKININL